MELVQEKIEIIRYRCPTHGLIAEGEKICGQCEKCVHGVTLNGQCDKCNDFDWQFKPITKEEFHRVRRSQHSPVYRRSPYPRQYVVTDLNQILMDEFAKIKGW